MIATVLSWVALVIAVEALVEICTEGKVFDGFRSRLEKLPKGLGWYLGGLSRCGYCFSVWAAIPAALAAPGRILVGEGWWWVLGDLVLKVLVIHRASNLWHKVVWRWIGLAPFVLAFRPKDEVGGAIPAAPARSPQDLPGHPAGAALQSPEGIADAQRDHNSSAPGA